MPTESIDRPGVEVIQEFVATAATAVRPALQANIQGVCNQVIEAVDDSGALNSDARVTVPGRIAFSYVSTPFEYAAIGGDALVVEVNGEPAVTLTFPGSGALTATEVVDFITSEEVPGLLAVVETSGSQQRAVIYTASSGENASVRIATGTHADVLSAFGILIGHSSAGFEGYANYTVLRPGLPDYPDPREIIDEVVIDYDSVRAFVDDGASNVREVLRTESFLNGATSSVTTQDDGDGDNLTPYLNFAGATFRAAAAVLTGTVDWTTLTYPGDFGTSTLLLTVNNSVAVTVTFASPGNAAAAIATVNSALGVNGTATLNGSNQPVLTSAITGAASNIEVLSTGTINESTIGLAVASYASGTASRARAVGIIDVEIPSYAAGFHDRVLRMSINGEPFQTLTVPSSVTDSTTLFAAINGLWGTIATGQTVAAGDVRLVLRAPDTFGGRESSIRVDKTVSDATLLTALGLTGGGAAFNTEEVVYGNPLPAAVGDEVWVDGIRLGTVTEIPAGLTNRLRLNVEQLLSFTGSTWTVIAKNLDNSAATATRPSSDLIVNETSGAVQLKAGLYRETGGVIPLAGPLSTYLAYDALRLDVSPRHNGFNLLRYGNTTDLEAALAPIDTQNPLGLGMYYGILNAPGIEVTGVGVPESSTTEPEGTLDGYTEVFEYLESKPVYALAPMTHSLDVGRIAQVHVDAMSEPDIAMERCVILNPSRPTRESDTVVASGARANVAGAPTDAINTGVANLQSLLAAAGYVTQPFTEDDGIFIELEDDTNKYLVQSVSGGVVTINDGILSASNDFYYDAAAGDVFSAAVVDRPFSLKIRGAAITNLTDEAAAYSDLGRGFADRRVIVMAPDTATATIDGLETSIAGYYMAAALAGKMSSSAPQQPFTEDSLVGFTGLTGSNDRYSEPQLKIMCGGGLWVMYHETSGQPIRVRHQLTTDMSTVKMREDSIRRALDYAAIFLRTTLRNFIGKYNITTNVIDAISTVLGGASLFLSSGADAVFNSFEVVAVRQSTENPDELEIDADVGVKYPLNKIRVTMRI